MYKKRMYTIFRNYIKRLDTIMIINIRKHKHKLFGNPIEHNIYFSKQSIRIIYICIISIV